MKPEPTIEGSILKAADDAEREMIAAFLQSLQRMADWGREGWRIAGIAQADCQQRD